MRTTSTDQNLIELFPLWFVCRYFGFIFIGKHEDKQALAPSPQRMDYRDLNLKPYIREWY
jgi:hypothetical protein